MDWDLFVIVVYLFYGGTFFALGIAISSRDTSLSKLSIARYLWIFALFAYIHGTHEWFEMLLRINILYLDYDISAAASIIKLGLVILSFMVLLLFGVLVLGVARPGLEVWSGAAFLVLVGAAAVFLTLPGEIASPAYFSWADFKVRNLVALPGAALTCAGFVLYSGTVRGISRAGALSFIGAGAMVMVYGVFAGVVPSGSLIPGTGLPVELFRGLAALGILYFMMRALTTFDEERKAVIEERLDRFVQTEKLSALGRLASGVAHEINNPLANLSLNLEILKKKLRKDGSHQPYLDRIEKMEHDLERASRIARELLHVASERDSDIVRTEVASVVDSAMNLLGPRKKDYRFTVNVSEAGTIQALPWKIEEALLNILINAMDATPPGGAISVLGRGDRDQEIIQVTDTGSGMTPGILNKVMEPFFTTKEVGQGTGLGLSICYGIMEQHHGRITIDSVPGEGTVVTLNFPKG